MAIAIKGYICCTVLITLVGCGSSRKPTIPVTDGVALPHHLEWRTTLQPRTAAGVIADSINEFGFHGGESLWGKAKPKVIGDYFEQSVTSTNANKQSINAKVRWADERRSTIAVESDLPEDRFEFVVKKIKQAVSEREKSSDER